MRFLLAAIVVGIPMATPAAARIEIDPDAVARWADKSFAEALEQKRLSGAVISVVRGGDIIFMKGYGYADYATKTPMDPSETKVRICSTSKIIVATALMQLVDEGLIQSLDDPANKYLKRVLLPRFGEKEVTVLDLTKHRAGLEDSFFNAGTAAPVETPVSAAILERLLPQMVRAPGSVSVYSNAAAAIQGALIEDVRGQPLGIVLEQHIFAPLNMRHTLLNDGPPAPSGHAQPCVLFSDGSQQPARLCAKHPVYAPSGGVYSTAEDMARFLIAHLNAGRGSGSAILSETSFSAMHGTITHNHPALTGLAVQFYVDEIGGQRVLSHGCGLPGFTSYLAIMPDSDVGLFVSVVSTSNHHGALSRIKNMFCECDGAMAASEAAPIRAVKFYYDFLKEFVGFGEPPPKIEVPAAELARYAGVYRVERRNFTTLLAALDLLFPESASLVVESSADQGLTINGVGPFVPIAEHVFQKGDTANPLQRYAFEVNDAGDPIRLLNSAAIVATRATLLDNPHTARSSLMWLAGIGATGLLCCAFPAGSRGARLAKWLPTLLAACVAAVFFASSVGFAASQDAAGIEQYVNEGRMLRLVVVCVACNLIALIAVSMAYAAIRSWKVDYWGIGPGGTCRRSFYCILAIAALGFLPPLYSYNLIGIHLP